MAKTIQQLRDAYQEAKDTALAAGFTGNFQDACRAALGPWGQAPKLAPEKWVTGAKRVAKELVARAQQEIEDERRYDAYDDEPWEVAHGPQEWPRYC